MYRRNQSRWPTVGVALMLAALLTWPVTASAQLGLQLPSLPAGEAVWRLELTEQ